MPNTTNYNWATPADTDLVKDGAAAIRTLGSSADTTVKNLNPGTTAGDIDYYTSSTAKARVAIGTAGQVLRVNSGGTAPEWATTADQTPLTTKGDLFTFTTVDARLGVGANGTVLTADSAETTGLKWVAPAGGGKLLQVINAETATASTSTTSTYADTNLTATITPSSTASKVLVTVHQSYKSNANGNGMGIKLFRGATELKAHGGLIANSSAAGEIIFAHFSISYLDSPNTTSATTYKTQFSRQNGIATVTVNPDSIISYITLMEIGA